MAQSQGQHSYGVQLYSAALGTAPPVTFADLAGWSNVGEVISLNGVPIQSAVTKLTHLASPSKAHEKIAGFIDGGQLTCKLNLSRAEMGAIYARLQGTGAGRTNSNLQWFVYFPDPFNGGEYLEGFLQQMPHDVPEDDRLTLDITIEISGLPALVGF